MWETRLPSLGWEDPLEKEMATHSSTLAWRSMVGYSPRGRKELEMTEWKRIKKENFFCHLKIDKACNCVDHREMWKALQQNTRPSYPFPRNLNPAQEATVRTLYGTTDWFKIEKGVWQGCLLSPCLFNLYTENITRNTGLDELQAGIKIGGSNINNFNYVDDNHSNGRKWRGTEEPLDEGERGEWKRA